MASCNVAFIGLGVMGYPMAGHLAKAGHQVTVFNRTSAKAEKWVAEHGGAKADTPAAAAQGAEFVFACVGNDDDLRSVVHGGDGVLAGLDKGATFVDHTTASADIAREFADAVAGQGCGFLDAPVSGGQAGAENGALTVMVGGEPATFDTARPVMDVYAKAVTLMGPAGAGQLTKMANQICIAGCVQGLSEGLNFAVQAGLDGKLVADVISKGAAQSWQMENRYATMLDDKFDFGFAVDWMCKDLDIALAEGKRCRALLPVTALVGQFYREIQARGGGRWDTSSLIRLLKP
jgi:3-hydroxyisobutyrate dehydrogenase-like beta-hydroxyacid dehydrogenase